MVLAVNSAGNRTQVTVVSDLHHKHSTIDNMLMKSSFDELFDVTRWQRVQSAELFDVTRWQKVNHVMAELFGVTRWQKVQSALDAHKNRLDIALEIHAFNRDLDDINDRINEKVC